MGVYKLVLCLKCFGSISEVLSYENESRNIRSFTMCVFSAASDTDELELTDKPDDDEDTQALDTVVDETGETVSLFFIFCAY